MQGLCKTPHRNDSEGTGTNVETKQKPFTALLLPVQSWISITSPKNDPLNLLKTIHEQTPSARGLVPFLLEESKTRWFPNAARYQILPWWHLDFLGAVGPSQKGVCSLSTLQRCGAGETLASQRLHWFQPNVENYDMFAKILMCAMLQC